MSRTHATALVPESTTFLFKSIPATLSTKIKFCLQTRRQIWLLCQHQGKSWTLKHYLLFFWRSMQLVAWLLDFFSLLVKVKFNLLLLYFYSLFFRSVGFINSRLKIHLIRWCIYLFNVLLLWHIFICRCQRNFSKFSRHRSVCKLKW